MHHGAGLWALNGLAEEEKGMQSALEGAGGWEEQVIPVVAVCVRPQFEGESSDNGGQ